MGQASEINEQNRSAESDLENKESGNVLLDASAERDKDEKRQGNKEIVLAKMKSVFYTANTVEMFERAAFYGMFISITLYLTNIVGFTDIEAGWIGGAFSALLYFAPTFAGVIADKIGFRKALLIAFALLAVGYALMGFLYSKEITILNLVLILCGGAFIKSVVTGTVAQCSSEANRGRAFAIFYMMVNIGSFSGKTVSKFIRVECGLEYITLLSAALCLASFIVVWIWFRNIDSGGETRTIEEIWRGFIKVLSNGRFMALIIIVGGFWAIQHQLYATMPKYVIRTIGESASPEWYANINPLVVVCCVAMITSFTDKFKISSLNSIGIALFLIPFSALAMSMSSVLYGYFGNSMPLLFFTIHPVTFTLLLGIAIQGLSECFLSPRFLEYASKQAPKGETALYMGYSHINSFFGNLLGFGVSGYLLEMWCPDPATLPVDIQKQIADATVNGVITNLPSVYSHAHYIWYVFAGIGFLAFLALLIFAKVTAWQDRKSGALASED